MKRKVGACAVLALAALLVLSTLAVLAVGAVRAQSTFADIRSYRVTGAVDYRDPGNESFWTGIDWTDVHLAASVGPGGGKTPAVLVKSANDGFNIYVLLRWNDTAGPSFAGNEELYRATNGSLEILDERATANVTQLYYNDTYYYQDRAALLWFLPQSIGRQESPIMRLGTGGALTGGAAEIWHWQSNPTDNNPADPDFPGGYTTPAGTPIYPSDNLSFAEADYTNMTGFFPIAGSFGAGAPNLDPYADPFLVHVGSSYSTATKQWTVEMVRTLTTSDAAAYRVQLATGSTYYTAYAIWNGRLGESAHIKSVSQWYTLTISDQAPGVGPTAVAGVPLNVAVAVGVGMLLVGVMIGVVVRSFRKGDKT